MIIKHRTFAAIVGTAALCGLALPAAANAGTVTKEGDTLVLTASPGEKNNVLISEGQQPGYINISDDVATTYPDECVLPNEYATEKECPVPAKVKLILGDGNDYGSILSSGIPSSMSLEFHGGDGNDTLKDTNINDERVANFDGGPGDDKLDGGYGNDILHGGEGNDEVDGGVGHDQVFGDGGDDQLFGDHYGDPGNDVIDGGAGTDRIESEWVQPDKSVNPPVTVLQDGVANDGRPGETDNVVGIEKIKLTVNGNFSGDDSAQDFEVWNTTADGGSTMKGLGGDDRLKTYDGRDTIDGGAGNDQIEGGFNDDTIIGGPGQDNINGDQSSSYCGWYSCKLPFGNDRIEARDGEADSITCGAGQDVVVADAIDTVNADCETVELPGGKTSNNGNAGNNNGSNNNGNNGTNGGAALKASVTAVKLSKALSGGLKVKVVSPGAGFVKIDVMKGAKKVGTTSGAASAKGKTFTVKLTAAARKSLKKAKSVKLTVKVTYDAGTGTKTTTTKKITLKK